MPMRVETATAAMATHSFVLTIDWLQSTHI
jgi:hypothetical protein